MKRKETGVLGEKLAADFLRKRGYRVLETNYRCPGGEIDLVTLCDGCLVFVEVRTKSNLEYGSPEESITSTKMHHMERTADYYLQHHAGLPDEWRVDLVAVELESGNKLKRIEIIENVLEG